MTRWLSLPLTIFVVACGGHGDGGGGGNGAGGVDPREPKVPQKNYLTTDVKLRALDYEMPTMTSCMKRRDPYQLPVLAPGTLKIDGFFDDWTKIPSGLADPLGDAAPGFDIGDGSVAVDNESIAIALGFRPLGAVTLNFEWGGAVAQKGTLNSEVRKILRFANGKLEKYQDGVWTTLSAEAGTAVVGATGTELLLSREAVGDVVTWPVWWVRAFTRDETANVVMDSTAAAYFPSILNPDDAPFTFSSCENWNGQRLPFTFVQIQDSAMALGTKKGATPFPIGSVAEWSQQLARLALDSSAEMLSGDPVPIARLGLIATVNKIGTTKSLAGIDPSWFGEAAPYRGMFTDANHLAPETTEGFPQGKVLETGASHFLDMYLQNLIPSAPTHLVRAVRQGILDQLLIRYVGTSYWLDYFPLGVAPLLKASDAENPVPIPELPAGAFKDAKILSFGHLLGRDLSPQQLISGWKAAAQYVKNGSAPEMALKRAVIEQRGGNSVLARRMASLWKGWYEKLPYDPDLGPGAMADKDQDGLPNFFEAKFGTRFDLPDTDGDGWNDFGEVVLGIDPRLENKTPAVVVPDGNFSDWQMLLPQRMAIDKGSSGVCAKNADIHYYSAVANRDYLVIAAVADDFWEGDATARWEAIVDLPRLERQALVTASSDSQELLVKRIDVDVVTKRFMKAIPTARKTIEWAVHRSAFGVNSYFDGDQGVKVRLRTIHTENDKDIVCDETGWFAPIISG